jgi:Cdc6-like AAA superfamily ATPase
MIRLIAGRRQTGRTTTLIELCAEKEAAGEVSYIVVANHQQAYAIAQKAQEMGLSIGFPLTYTEFIERRWAGNHIKHFFIDNVEHFLSGLAAPVNVEAVVFEIPEEES